MVLLGRFIRIIDRYVEYFSTWLVAGKGEKPGTEEPVNYTSRQCRLKSSLAPTFTEIPHFLKYQFNTSYEVLPLAVHLLINASQPIASVICLTFPSTPNP